MQAVGQCLMVLQPALAYVSRDGENAVGRKNRANMLRAAAKHCPSHGKYLAGLWQGPSRCRIENEPGDWGPMNQWDGTAQGGTSSTPIFSRGYREVIARAQDRLEEECIHSTVLILVDLAAVAPKHVDWIVHIFITVVLTRPRSDSDKSQWRQAINA